MLLINANEFILAGMAGSGGRKQCSCFGDHKCIKIKDRRLTLPCKYFG